MDNRIRAPFFSEKKRANHHVRDYDLFNQKLREYSIEVETGIFGADMKVSILNDGPVTILLESRSEND